MHAEHGSATSCPLGNRDLPTNRPASNILVVRIEIDMPSKFFLFAVNIKFTQLKTYIETISSNILHTHAFFSAS